MWQGIVGHDAVVERFRRTLASGRLASTYLFVGPPGVGKRRFATELAHALLCTEAEEAALAPCGRCPSCRLFATGNHPDLEVVGLPADKTMLPIALFVGDDEHRNQEGLCQRIALKPFFGRRRIAIIDDADYFSIASANCLLKTLEEPPPSALLILVGTSPARQLPTIRSRSQIVRFRALDRDSVAQILIERGLVADREAAARAAALSEGSVARAVEISDSALGQFREQLRSVLQSRGLDRVRLGRAVQAFVDEAGKEAALRRDRLRMVLGFAVELYRSEVRRRAAEGDCANERLDRAEPIIRSLDASLQALEHVDRNANQATVIQSWCEELAPLGGAADGMRAAVRNGR
jgi:DNA polymerase-3 subunit delta'